MEAKSTRRQYTLAEKQAILELADREGPRAAAAAHGVPPGTIHNWQTRDRERITAAAATTTTAPEVEKTDAEKHASQGRRYAPAERRLILAAADEVGPAAAAQRYGCSTWSIHSWRKQAHRQASRSSHSRPESPSDDAQLTPEQAERHTLVRELWRTHPGFGPSQIRNQLKRLGYKISVHTVRDIITDAGYIQPRVKSKTPPRAYEAARPMELYHIDFVQFFIHKLRQSLLLIEDDYSRFIAGWALLKSEHADGVIEALDTAVNRYGRPEGVMCDRASCFFSFKGVARFERHITDDNINYFPIDEAHKNGKVEKLNAAVRKELLSKVEFADLDDAVIRIGAWVHGYNYRRTHMGLGGLLVPADRFHGMAEDALRRIEQGNGASPLDVLTPSGRGLEIFRVCSTGGTPSVYLMGRKIL